MKTGFSILSLIFSSVMMAQSVHLTVPAVDPSNHALAIGTAYFTWGTFAGNDGITVPAGQLTRPVTSGTIDVTLTASDNAGYVYTLLLMHGSTADTFKWRVPAAGATTMAELNQPASNNGDSTVVRTDQANIYTAGKKQTFSSSAATAGEGFGGVSSDPSTVVSGDRWFRTDIHHMRIYDGATGQTVMYQSDTLPWNQLGNPTGATSLLFAANPFNITFGSATGPANMMTVMDTASNTGTGYVFTAGTGTGSAANPLQALCKGLACFQVFADGHIATSQYLATGVNGLRIGAFATLAMSGTQLFVGQDQSQINFGNGTADLTSTGTAKFAGLQTATAKKTTNYTSANDDLSLPCDATTGNLTITLPAEPKPGEWKGLKKVDSSGNTCTYSGNGKDIEGSATLVYSTQYQHAMAQYDGTQWWLY